MLARLLGERITLKIEPAAGLWAVQADRSQIEQVFINLAVACREAMPAGGVVDITLKNESRSEAMHIGEQILPAGSYVLVSLNLLPESDKSHLRNLYKNRSVAAARTVLEQNEGVLFVRPDRQGTAGIQIYFSSVAEGTASKAPESAPRRTSKAAAILLVEDDSSMRQFTKTVLSRLGHHVEEAANGEEALELFARNGKFTPDLLIADMVMPRLGGLDLANTFSKKLPDAAVLLVSGYPEQQAIAQQSGHAFLKKPFTVGELISRVGTLLAD
jgi:two-component system cell cycle sensor histidine kinase/response regulator CckA